MRKYFTNFLAKRKKNWFAFNVRYAKILHFLHKKYLTNISITEVVTSSMISVKPITGYGKTLLTMPLSCPGGITATRLPEWPIEQHWWTTTLGTIHTLHWLAKPCPQMSREPTKSWLNWTWITFLSFSEVKKCTKNFLIFFPDFFQFKKNSDFFLNFFPIFP